MTKVYAKKNECPVCGKKLIYVKISKPDGKTTHKAIHEGDNMPENAVKIDFREISHTYRKRLRDAIEHVNVTAKPVFDATGMNRFTMIAEVITIIKDAGVSHDQAEEIRAEMLAKGNGFVEDIAIAAPFITIIR